MVKTVEVEKPERLAGAEGEHKLRDDEEKGRRK